MTAQISSIVFIANLVFSIAIAAYVLLLMPASVLSSVILGATVASTVFQIWFFLSGSPKLRQLYLYIVMLHALYLFAEFVVYVLFAFNMVRTDVQFLDNKLEANTKPWAQYDSLVGYKGVPGSFRTVKYSNNEVVYNHLSHINPQGWFSKQPYVARKKPGIKRYAVLGDSFSAGLNVPTPWPDLLAAKLDSVEIYNFALEGIGINNWSLIYYHEILKYEFDGLIIAISNEQYGIPDMDRKLMVMHSYNQATYVGLFDTLPTAANFFNGLPQMTKGYAIMPAEKIDDALCAMQPGCSLKASLPPANLYLLSTAIIAFKQLGAYFKLERDMEQYKAALAARFAANRPMATMADYRQKYPYAPQLEAILNHCQQTGKEVILATIPDASGALDQSLAERTQSEVAVLATAYHLPCFNGFSCFEGMADTLVGNYYYRHDLHWNPAGANLFAARFAQWLSERNGAR